jgi:hypothetical protein
LCLTVRVIHKNSLLVTAVFSLSLLPYLHTVYTMLYFCSHWIRKVFVYKLYFALTNMHKTWIHVSKNLVSVQPTRMMDKWWWLSKYIVLSYVYRTVHHLDSWIKRDQLDITCFLISLFHAQHVLDVNTSILRSLRLICRVSLAFLFHYFMLNMFRMLIYPSLGACNLFAELFHGLYCSGTMRVGVTLWFGRGGVVSRCRLKPASGYNPWSNSANKLQAPKDGCINIQNMLSMK